MLCSVRVTTLAQWIVTTVFIAFFMVAQAATFGVRANETGAWTVMSVEGSVTVNGGKDALLDTVVGQGAVIETGADGKVTLTRPGDSITVFPNSMFSVPETGGSVEPGILQSLGKLLFRMESRESRDFKIETPYLAAAIKGTTFTVEVGDGDATVTVSEGSVLVSANRSGQSSYVGPGQRASVGGRSADSVRVSMSGTRSGTTGVQGGDYSTDDMEREGGNDDGGTSDTSNSRESSDPSGSDDGKDSSADHDSGIGNDDK